MFVDAGLDSQTISRIFVVRNKQLVRLLWGWVESNAQRTTLTMANGRDVQQPKTWTNVGPWPTVLGPASAASSPAAAELLIYLLLLLLQLGCDHKTKSSEHNLHVSFVQFLLLRTFVSTCRNKKSKCFFLAFIIIFKSCFYKMKLFFSNQKLI